MKKLLILLLSLLISFKSYSSFFGVFDKTICVKTDAQVRNDLYYLPNETKPYTGKNLCKNENGQIKSEGNIKKGTLVSETRYRYHVNGQKEVEQNFKNGKKDGKVIYWWVNGKKMIERNWKEGVCISGCN